MCTNGSGMYSVKPPVRRCTSRARSMWRAQWIGRSIEPAMMVTFERNPTRWAVSWTSSHSSVGFENRCVTRPVATSPRTPISTSMSSVGAGTNRWGSAVRYTSAPVPISASVTGRLRTPDSRAALTMDMTDRGSSFNDVL